MGASQQIHDFLIICIGYEVKNGTSSLVLFDPGTSGRAILNALQSGASGWQRHVKRSLEKLKKPQFQIVYIKPGFMTDEERNVAKVLTSDLIKA